MFKSTCMSLLAILIISLFTSTWASRLDSGFVSGILSFTFDDGRIGQRYIAAEILRAAGFAATAFVYPSGLNGQSGFLSEDQVTELQNLYGWEIGSETATHKDLTTCVTYDCLQKEIVGSRDILRGFDWNITSFAYPFGKASKNITVRPIVESSYNAARVVVYPSKPPPQYGNVSLDLFAINSNDVLNSTSVETVRGWIETAIQTRTWLLLRFHQISRGDSSRGGSGNYPASNFQAIVDYARSHVEDGSLRVMRFNSAIDRIFAIRSGKEDFMDPVPPRGRPPNTSQEPKDNNSTPLPEPVTRWRDNLFLLGVPLAASILTTLGLWMVLHRHRRPSTPR